MTAERDETAPSPFTLLGDPDAVACDGDSCEIPAATVRAPGDETGEPVTST
ncbi:hypothetical protein LX16_2206 [Stackebrandtia albiflava]|uniref:Uncharacterized protein n=1 Tax=Stackebrandtia albiflava TaxID=406432 RepID=A0A562V0S8_9ACTN|nr:hypothetical protein [Stackebrandtia albiflava]TWJ11484.1 hypothetical protein LX16_2206 [Stackebrandtia albiflava]